MSHKHWSRIAGAVIATLALSSVVSCANGDEPAAEPDASAGTSPQGPGPGEPGFHDDVPVDDGRDYDVYVPTGFDAAPVPAILVLHGMPGSAAESRSQSGMDVLADEQNVLAVYPNQPSTRWSADVEDAAELDYFRNVVADLVDNWNADPDRVHVAGISNGADMALTLGAALPDLFSAVAPVVPSSTGEVAEAVATIEEPVPMIGFVGGYDSRHDSGMELMTTWTDRAGCGDAEVEEVNGITVHRFDCENGPMAIYDVHEGTHRWFGDPEDRDPLWVSETLWEFVAALA